jgi:putative Holliday junction resolvase
LAIPSDPARAGPILALDFGLRRIGAAVSDRERRYASPLEVYERRNAEQDARHYRLLVADHGVTRIVVGLPASARGADTPLARQARDFGAWLQGLTGLAVVYHDERYSSLEADELLRAQGLKASQRKGLRDQIAAQLILQAYLEAGCPEQSQEPTPLEDAP